MTILSRLEKLWLIKRRLGLSTNKAAKRWGIKASTLRAYESGHRDDPQKDTANSRLINKLIAENEAREGVLHEDWQRPTKRRPSVTKKQIRKSNDTLRSPTASRRDTPRRRGR